ncbi:GNAT family protein [Mammaliicoccus sciuri]|uniref:GNAT family N-acetyltransferase n=1 Tax=Mammaliicoccus sciuri TaxID=1296 RepID=UPI00265C282A|nr:GNAT family protein [Mammaliicoccus sciuri]MDO0957530.1 GNAT family protein [Mammaliicoccus sciuri]MDT0702314.1 GNAT family protein [Mammaliicoccus sciuri]
MDVLVELAENQILETERLILRPINLNDVESLFEYASDVENTTHVFPTHLSKEDTKSTIAGYYMKAPLGKYGIELKSEDKLIGTIDLRVEQEHKRGELGYALNLKYTGNGYMTEAGLALLTLSFETLGLNQVKAMHSTINPKSGEVMKRLGMKKIGVMPKNRIHKEKIVDDVIYAITDTEYAELVKSEK